MKTYQKAIRHPEPSFESKEEAQEYYEKGVKLQNIPKWRRKKRSVLEALNSIVHYRKTYGEHSLTHTPTKLSLMVSDGVIYATNLCSLLWIDNSLLPEQDRLEDGFYWNAEGGFSPNEDSTQKLEQQIKSLRERSLTRYEKLLTQEESEYIYEKNFSVKDMDLIQKAGKTFFYEREGWNTVCFHLGKFGFSYLSVYLFLDALYSIFTDIQFRVWNSQGEEKAYIEADGIEFGKLGGVLMSRAGATIPYQEDGVAIEKQVKDKKQEVEKNHLHIPSLHLHSYYKSSKQEKMCDIYVHGTLQEITQLKVNGLNRFHFSLPYEEVEAFYKRLGKFLSGGEE